MHIHRITDFYPRPPRGGRQHLVRVFLLIPNFYPRPPRGGRPGLFLGQGLSGHISTHALREEGDAIAGRIKERCGISTHALREEGDRAADGQAASKYNFYPRPPRGGRPEAVRADVLHQPFLPTPSARRATTSIMSGSADRAYFYPRPPRGGRPKGAAASESAAGISTHALREEGDVSIEYMMGWSDISTHALREEGDARPH